MTKEELWKLLSDSMPSLNDIKVEYDGAYPNLCSGHLKVTIFDKMYDFGSHCLISGGGINYDYECESGPWSIDDWPNDFPKCLKSIVLEKINDEVCHGCCGGCI